MTRYPQIPTAGIGISRECDGDLSTVSNALTLENRVGPGEFQKRDPCISDPEEYNSIRWDGALNQNWSTIGVGAEA